jgi:hypothetical protein
MANFVRVLSPEAKVRILSRLQRRQPALGLDDLDDIASVFDLDFYFPLDDGLLPEENLADNLLSTNARVAVLEHMATRFENKRRRIRKNFDALLNKEKEVNSLFSFNTNVLWPCYR